MESANKKKTMTINKDSVARMKTLMGYISKLESICPLNGSQLFVADNGKLTIHGYGSASLGSGFIKATFDVGMEPGAGFFFLSNLKSFIQLLEKTKSGEITVTLNDTSELIFKGNQSRSQFKQVTLNADGKDAKEVHGSIDLFKTSNPYKQAIDFKVGAIRDKLQNMSAVTNLLAVNQYIKVTSDSIMSADNVSIIKIPTGSEVVPQGSEFLLHRGVIGLCGETDVFKICNFNDTTWIFIDIPVQGIEMYFAEEAAKYMCPTDDEIATLLPQNGKVVLTLKPEQLYEAIDEFQGVFDSASWKYGQVKMTVPYEKGKPVSPLQLHYDNMVSCVDTDLDCTFEEDTITDKSSFVIQIPTLHLKFLADELSGEQVKLTFSNDPNEILATLERDDVKVHLVKMDD